jgi:hypothetical protein
VEQNPPYTFYFKQRNAEQLAQYIEQQLPVLSPGPDVFKEQTAFEQNTELMIEFGRNVIRMAKSIQ